MPPRKFPTSEIAWPLLIAAVGLALRLAFVREYVGHPIGRIAWVDEAAYRSMAERIARGTLLPDRPFYQDPLLPYALAGLMQALGTVEVAPLRMALACLGALTPLAVYGAGRVGFGKAEAIVAGLATAFHGPLIFTDGLLEKEGMAALVAAIALGLSARAVAVEKARAWAIGAGLAWGVLALLRANALILGPILAIGMAWGGRRGRGLALLAGFLAALAPSTIVNAVVSRPTELIVTTWQGGANFYIGNGPEATGTYRAPAFVEANPAREADDFAAEAVRRAGRPLSPNQVSRFWLVEGLNRWRSAPGGSIQLLFHKAGLLAHRTEIPDNQDAEAVEVIAAPALGWGAIGFGLLFPLGALGMCRSPPSPFWWVVAGTTVVGLGSTAAFFVVGRYRIPWVPGLALLAGAGVVDFVRLARGRRWRGLAWRLVLVAAPACWLCWRPLPDPAPDRWGHAQIGLAVAYLEAGDLEPAIDALDDASAMGPGPAARVATLRDSSQLREPMAALIAKSWPRERDPLRRARWLRQLPKGRRESLSLLELESYLHPGAPGPLREQAAWNLGRGDDPEARRRAVGLLERAIQVDPHDRSAVLLLALLEPANHPWPRAHDDDEPGFRTRLRLAKAILSHLRRAGPERPARDP